MPADAAAVKGKPLAADEGGTAWDELVMAPVSIAETKMPVRPTATPRLTPPEMRIGVVTKPFMIPDRDSCLRPWETKVEPEETQMLPA